MLAGTTSRLAVAMVTVPASNFGVHFIIYSVDALILNVNAICCTCLLLGVLGVQPWDIETDTVPEQ